MWLSGSYHSKEKTMFIIISGNVVDGLSFIGPFESHEEAIEYCEGSDDQWNIVELQNPRTYFMK